MYHARKELLVSVLIFWASVLVGIVSAANDDNFVRLILGNGYVDMTLDNIARGEPMAVYNGSEEVPMFLGITLNNIMVSFNVFAMGLLTSFGTGWLLFNNGVMLGAFQTFFFKHGLLGESMLAIWLHGTLEIWAIIVAGAAGLALGNGWLFPGTYSRKESFMRGAKKGLKIIVGTVPIFIMAGIYRRFYHASYRITHVLRLGIILLSLSFIIYYYIYLPNRKTHGITKNLKIALYVKRPFGDKLNATMDFIKENWKPMLKFCTYLILPLCLIQAISMNGIMGGAMGIAAAKEAGTNSLAAIGMQFWVNYGLMFLCYLVGSILLTSIIYGLMQIYNQREERLAGVTFADLKPFLFKNIRRLLVMVLFCIGLTIVVGIVMGILVVASPFTLLLTVPLLIACAVPLALFTPIYLFEEIGILVAFWKTFRLGFATWGGVFLVSLVMGLISSVLQGVTTTPWYIATIVKYFFMLSDTQNELTISAGYSFMVYLLAIVQTFGAYLSMIFSLIGMVYQYGHASEVVDSISVESEIDKFEQL